MTIGIIYITRNNKLKNNKKTKTMKKIALLFATSLVLTSCGGGAEKSEAPATDSTAVVVAADSCTATCADSTKCDSAVVK